MELGIPEGSVFHPCLACEIAGQMAWSNTQPAPPGSPIRSSSLHRCRHPRPAALQSNDLAVQRLQRLQRCNDPGTDRDRRRLAAPSLQPLHRCIVACNDATTDRCTQRCNDPRDRQRQLGPAAKPSRAGPEPGFSTKPGHILLAGLPPFSKAHASLFPDVPRLSRRTRQRTVARFPMPEPLPRRRRGPDPTAALAQVVTKIHRSEPERPTRYLLSVPGQFEGVTLRLWAQKPDNC
jgi:hypothetical protein